MAVGDIFEFRLFTSFNEQIAINVLHYKEQTPTNPFALDHNSVLAAIATAIEPVFIDCVTADATYEGCTLQRIFPTVAPVVTNVLGSAAGDGGATPTGRQLSGIITKRTVIAGRRGRGRIYVPFPAADTVTDDTGMPTAAYVALLQELADEMEDEQTVSVGADTLGFKPCVYNRDDPAASPLITTCLARSKFATQRRRGDYGRANSLPF